MNFTNYLYTRNGDYKININRIEEKYFKIISQNMINKSLNRVNNIKKRISNDVSKQNFNKKYQIKSLYEYNEIKKFYQTLNIKNYELCLQFDENIKTNKLKQIIEGHYYCCKDCDRPMKFINEKIDVLYCCFKKK